MRTLRSLFRETGLDRTGWPGLRDRILESDAPAAVPRSYPGHPRTELPRAKPRAFISLEKMLVRRRSARALSTALPSPAELGRILQFSHGAVDASGRGPVPSAGGLQALELYVTPLSEGWLARGVHHYDRAGGHLSKVADGEGWATRVPSMATVEGGALLWVIVGDGARAEEKYGERAFRFLLLEAGHLMQNLCLVSAGLGLCTVPLGAFYEGELAEALRLPKTDAVLYVGVCGRATS